jgi:hypothetical protein
MTHLIVSEFNNNLDSDGLAEDSLLPQTLSQALETTQNLLTNLATAEDFSAKMSLSFGNSYNTQTAKLLAQDWAKGDFSSLPSIEIRSASEINGAKGIRDRLRKLHFCQDGAGKGDKFSLATGFRMALTTPKS